MIVDGRKYRGMVVIDTKLYLQDKAGRPMIETFIPIEKIESMNIRGRRLEISVFPSVVASFTACLLLDDGNIKLLAGKIAEKGRMKKAFLLNRWRGDIYMG